MAPGRGAAQYRDLIRSGKCTCCAPAATGYVSAEGMNHSPAIEPQSFREHPPAASLGEDMYLLQAPSDINFIANTLKSC